MLTFLRKTRKSSIGSGSTKKYLLYAIGEIALVVIGILIALQINNWNESRKALNNERRLYLKFVDDLRSDSSSIAFLVDRHTRYQKVNYHLYEVSQGRASFDPDLPYNGLYYINIFDPIVGLNYQESASELLSDSIRYLLKDYVLQENRTLKATKMWDDFKFQVFRPFCARNGLLDSKEAFSKLPPNQMSWIPSTRTTVGLINLDQLQLQLGTLELDQILAELRFHAGWLIRNAEFLAERNEELKQTLLNILSKD